MTERDNSGGAASSIPAPDLRAGTRVRRTSHRLAPHRVSLPGRNDALRLSTVGRHNEILPSLQKYIRLRRLLAGKEDAKLPDEQEHPLGLEDNQLGDTNSDDKEITSEPIIMCCCSSPNINAILAESTRRHLRHIGWLLEEVVRGSQEKVGLAQAAYDSVRVHANALLEP